MSESLDVPVPRRLYTWVDVDAHLAMLASRGLWPAWVRECNAYWDALVVTVEDGTPNETVWNWLVVSFGPLTIDIEHEVVQLEGVDPGNDRRLPVQITSEAADTLSISRTPSWSEKYITRELAEPLPLPSESEFAGGRVKVCAFHSYKGGVGRTLHSMALARVLASNENSSQRVLLVDADLEAPGITWMFAAEQNEIDFSFEDYLALLHGSVDGTPTEAIALARHYLENQDLGGIVVLPARRDVDRVSPPPITPIDLLHESSRDKYYLTDSLAELACAVGADVVIIDLRAGTSELSAPILLDPRVHRVFVTTLSDQSMRGTIRLLEEIGRRAPATRETDPVATVLVTQHLPERSPSLTEAAARLAAAVVGTVRPSGVPSIGEDQALDVELDVAARPALSAFESDLVALPGRWTDVVETIRRNRLEEVVADLADALRPKRPEIDSTEYAVGLENVDDLRIRLADYCGDHFASLSRPNVPFELMSTEFHHFFTRNVSIGAPMEILPGNHGSGKTTSFIALCKASDWDSFTDSVRMPGISLQTRDAHTAQVRRSRGISICPVFGPRDACERISADTALRPLIVRFQEVRNTIERALNREPDADQWSDIWIRCLALSAGIDPGAESDREALVRLARERRTVFVFDGLDELLPHASTHQMQAQALNSLWNEVIPWLDTLRGNLGIIALINPIQMPERLPKLRYGMRHTALDWQQDDALNFVAWLCERSGVVERERSGSPSDLANSFNWLWGQRLGPSGARVAKSIDWFLDSVSDLDGSICASDVVAFIGEAARLSTNLESHENTVWRDRLLTPAAMSEAIRNVSHNKIESVLAQDPIIGPILEKMRDLDSELKVLPFDVEAAGLTRPEVRFLLRNSILHRTDAGQYWLAKLYRYGLNFKATEWTPRLTMFRQNRRYSRNARRYLL